MNVTPRPSALWRFAGEMSCPITAACTVDVVRRRKMSALSWARSMSESPMVMDATTITKTVRSVVVQGFRQVKRKGNLSVLLFGGQLGQTLGATVVGGGWWVV